MTDPLDRVRQIMDQAEDVDLPEGLVPPAGEAGAGDEDPGWDGVDPGPPPGPPPEEGETPPPEKLCVDLPLNDFGNGRRLLVHYGSDLAYVSRLGWFRWSGKRYQPDPDGIEVRRLAHRLTELIAREIWHMDLPAPELDLLSQDEAAKAELDELGVIPPKNRSADQIERLAQLAALRKAADDIRDRRDKSIGRRLTHAKSAGNSSTITNAMAEAAAMIARPLEDFDARPLDINTESGVLRFWTEPGEDDGGQHAPHPVARFELVSHDRGQLLTKIMPVEYDPAARCPGFMAYLERVQPQPEMRRFLQRWLGLSMTGIASEQVFAFFHGGGANGKSVMLELMARMMGDYAASAKIEAITGKNRRGAGDPTPDLMLLIGARFVRTSEPEEGVPLLESLVKDITGGEPMLVRDLHLGFLKIYPIFKLTMAGNHRPEIRGGDDGIWRRVLLVPWDVQIPADERDKQLVPKLFEERSGILNWLVEGLIDYLQHGLQVPEAVSAATAEYREDSDPTSTFLTTCCLVTGAAADSLPAKVLGEAMAYWLDDTGRGTWKTRTIFNRLKAKAGRWKSPGTGQIYTSRKSSSMHYDGIRLVDPFRARFLNAPRDQQGNIIKGRTDDLL